MRQRPYGRRDSTRTTPRSAVSESSVSPTSTSARGAPEEARRVLLARALPGVILGVYFFFAQGDGLVDRLLYGVIGGFLFQGLLMIAALVVVYVVHGIAGAPTNASGSMPDFKDLRFSGMLTALAIAYCLGMYWQHRAERDLVECLQKRGYTGAMGADRSPAAMAESCLAQAAERARDSSSDY